jgi:rRNA maturation protein Rpf1
MSLDGIAEKAIMSEADRVIVVDRWRGGPGKISLFQISSAGLEPFPPVMLMSGIRLRRELKEGKRVCSSVITVEPETSPDLERIAENLSKYFGLPLLPLDEAVDGHRASMHFSFDSLRRIQITFMLLSRMVEIGPRVTLSKLIWGVPS